jgi:hypothetical protein
MAVPREVARGGRITALPIAAFVVPIVTDLTMTGIAERMGCSRGRVGSINRRFEIRLFEKSGTPGS